jgi:dUTP pyrophosphatase
MTIQVKLLRPTARLPLRATADAAGADVYCDEDFMVPAGGRQRVCTGISARGPEGHYIQLHSRSSLAWHHGIHVVGGVIDRDYTGEIKVILYNHSDETYYGTAGDRIAQMVCVKISAPLVKEVRSVMTEVGEEARCGGSRSSGGFGSTGR